MRKAIVFYKDEEAGILTQHEDGTFSFIYHNSWLSNPVKPGISVTLPKSNKVFYSGSLFPFFFNMLPEGSNKLVACKLNKVDEDDHFGLLITTAKNDTIGAVRVVKIEDK